MGRKRVSKGQIIIKKDQKIIDVLLNLPENVSDDDFVKSFQERYPNDWKRVQKRYDEHERLTPKGKRHPMAHPYKYMLNVSRKLRAMYAKGEDLNKVLEDLNAPKPKFVEGVPDRLEELLRKVADLTSYETRVIAVNSLGKYKCDETIAALSERLLLDPIYDVRQTAYSRLSRFGLEVEAPKKNSKVSDTEFIEKISHVVSQLKPGFSDDHLLRKFKALYPEDFDVQKYHLKNRLAVWLKKMVNQLPKNSE